MLEYFTSKKVKKAQADQTDTDQKETDQKEKGKAEVQVQEPLLSPEDENFLGRIISAEGTPPPLPDRPTWVTNPEVGDSTGNEGQMVVHTGAEQAEADERKKSGSSERKKSGSSERKKSSRSERRKSRSSESKKSGKEGKEKEKEKEKKGGMFSFLQRKNKDGLEPKENVSKPEAENEIDDISRVLDELNISASNNRAFSLSAESQNLVKQFTVILKDLINGVPTAYDDLVRLLNDSQGTLAKSYDHMPSYLKKLITTLPNKLTSTLAPELLAVAVEAQANLNGGQPVEGMSVDSSGGLKGAAKGLIGSIGLKELVTKPGTVVKLLKAIMNALKLRWPAFMGTNVLLSLALFVLLFVFWYCHKRGRETRIEREGRTMTVDSEGRIIELDDDPMLPGPGVPTEKTREANEGNSGVEDGISGPSTRKRDDDRSGSGRRSGSGKRN